MSAAIKRVQEAENPVLGNTYYFIYTILKAISFVFSTYLYEWNDHPDNPEASLSPYQFLVLKSGTSIIFMVLWLNFDLKK